MSSDRRLDSVVIEDWVSDDEEDEQVMSKPEVVKKAGTRVPKVIKKDTVKPS